MEHPKWELPSSSEQELRAASALMSLCVPTVAVTRGTQAACDSSTAPEGDRDPAAVVRRGAPAEASRSAAGGKEDRNKRQVDELPYELEGQFILRLPLEHACAVRRLIHSGSAAMKDKLKIDLSPDTRHAIVEVEDTSLSAKLVDLPCVIGSLKTLDKKTFYKTADISQMLVCSAGGDLHSSPQEPVSSTDPNAIGNPEKEPGKKYVWKHGITPPLKNVRKKRFRKIKKPTDFKQVEEINFIEEKSPAKHRVLSDTPGISSCTLLQFIESPDVEKEVKRLLCSDAEATSARWEVIADDGTKEIEGLGCIPSFPMSPETSDYKQRHISSEYDMLREMLSDSSTNNHENEEEEEEDEEEDEEDDEDEDDEEEEDEEEEDDSEEALERELQAKILELTQYESKEGTSSIVMEIQKQILYKEKKLQEIQWKAQRQKDLIRRVENLTLKSHLQSMLESLKIQEKQRNEQLFSLQEQLKYFLKI